MSAAACDFTDSVPTALQLGYGQPLPANTIDVETHRLWHNHFQPGLETLTPARRGAAVVDYAVWLAGRQDVVRARGELYDRDLACSCPIDQPCHRDVLLDLADPDAHTGQRYGRAYGLTVRRPWASLLLVPEALGGKNIENRTWTTRYRGPVLIIAGTRIDPRGLDAAREAGLHATWHTDQQGWLGAAVLTDVHQGTGECCQPWGQAPAPGETLYHWVFEHPARLASPVYGTGFLGLRKVPWTNLIRRNVLHQPPPTVARIH